ncbi:hypothetical protein FOZ63_004969, partial [Perkinsus olseni]
LLLSPTTSTTTTITYDQNYNYYHLRPALQLLSPTTSTTTTITYDQNYYYHLRPALLLSVGEEAMHDWHGLTVRTGHSGHLRYPTDSTVQASIVASRWYILIREPSSSFLVSRGHNFREYRLYVDAEDVRLGRWWLRTALRSRVQRVEGVDADRRLMGALLFCMFNHGFWSVWVSLVGLWEMQ